MPNVTGKSLPVRTRCTPGCCCAFSVLISSIKACGWGERSSFVCSMRGRTMSSANRVWPVTLARPSTRRRGLPRTFKLQPSRSFFDRLEDLLVSGTTTKISGNCLSNPGAARVRFFHEQRLGGHEDSRSAVAALRGAEVGERGLQRVQLGAARHAFDGLNRAALAFEREQQAGELRLAVDQHRAGAAFAELAAVLGAGEAEVLAQQLEQRLVRRERDFVAFAVDRQAELRMAHCLGPKQIVGATLLQSPGGGKGRAALTFPFPQRRISTPFIQEPTMSLRIGDEAPNFQAQTTEGPIDFHKWIGDKWAVLFSHPKDFTPVCTTELGTMAKLKSEFDRRNVKIIGLSADPVDDHKRWAKDIEETQGAAPNYPMIGDPDLKVAKLYDMLPAEATPGKRTPADNATVRTVFIIGPDKKIKLMLFYPMTTGRNFDEVLRVLDSIQLTAKHKVATPANWKQGQDVIIAGSVSDDDAKKLFPKGWKSPKPYLRITEQPK